MHPDSVKIELTELEISYPQMTEIRKSALQKAFEDGYLKSPPEATKMDPPRYMARIPGSPMKYEWQTRIVTSEGSLNDDGNYPSGLFKFLVTMDPTDSKPVEVEIKQIFV